jgi:DNA-binding NtrC family response regulator
VLKTKGYEVDIAKTGLEAIEKTENKWYNLALIDINLPDVNGIELLTRLKEGTPKMRKVILTGYPTMPNAVDAVNKQANAYLIKPVELPTLFETIKTQLEQQESEQKFDEEKMGEFMKTRAREFLQSKQGRE